MSNEHPSFCIAELVRNIQSKKLHDILLTSLIDKCFRFKLEMTLIISI